MAACWEAGDKGAIHVEELHRFESEHFDAGWEIKHRRVMTRRVHCKAGCFRRTKKVESRREL